MSHIPEVFSEIANDKSRQAGLLALARSQIAEELHVPAVEPDKKLLSDIPFNFRPGVFVTITKPTVTKPADRRRQGAMSEYELRGCIGNILGRHALADSVRILACDAAFHDPRFPPLTDAELARVRLEITLLTDPKPVASPKEIVVGRDGILFFCQDRQSVFLPQVATEQGWNLEQTLSALSRKAGLPPEEWRNSHAHFETFEGYHFSESDV